MKSHLNKEKMKKMSTGDLQNAPFQYNQGVFVAEHLVAVGRRAPRCGGVLQQRCQYPRDEEALDMHAKSLDIKARILGGDGHPDVAASHVNTGNTLQYSRAERGSPPFPPSTRTACAPRNAGGGSWSRRRSC
jgi:hypothetical protein